MTPILTPLPAADVAPLYGYGLREERLGSALSHVHSSDLIVGTKAGRLLTHGVVTNDYTAGGPRMSLEGSLQRMDRPRVHTLRIHDPNDSPERPDGVDEVSIALQDGDGMISEMVRMRGEGLIDCVSLGMNSNCEIRPKRPELALPPSLTDGIPAEIERLLKGAPQGTFDDALLAGGWTLLDQFGANVMLECQKQGVPVSVAGIFSTGLLQGRDSFAYNTVTPELAARTEQWRQLACEFQLSLPAVAIAFSYLPTVVHKVVIGMATAAEVEANLRAIEESNRVTNELWHLAQERGLLSEGIPLQLK